MNHQLTKIAAGLASSDQSPEAIERFSGIIDSEISKLHKLEQIEAGIEDSGRVCLKDVNAIESIFPGSVYNLALVDSQFTINPSTNGVTAALEAINWAKVGKWGIILTIIGLIAAIFKARKHDAHVDSVNKVHDKKQEAHDEMVRTMNAEAKAREDAMANESGWKGFSQSAPKPGGGGSSRFEDLKNSANSARGGSRFGHDRALEDMENNLVTLVQTIKEMLTSDKFLDFENSPIARSGHWTPEYLIMNKVERWQVMGPNGDFDCRSTFLYSKNRSDLDMVRKYIENNGTQVKEAASKVVPIIKEADVVFKDLKAHLNAFSRFSKDNANATTLDTSVMDAGSVILAKIPSIVSRMNSLCDSATSENAHAAAVETIEKMLDLIYPRDTDRRKAVSTARKDTHTEQVDPDELRRTYASILKNASDVDSVNFMLEWTEGLAKSAGSMERQLNAIEYPSEAVQSALMHHRREIIAANNSMATAFLTFIREFRVKAGGSAHVIARVDQAVTTCRLDNYRTTEFSKHMMSIYRVAASIKKSRRDNAQI